jgi:uncharacterized iron-regulated membrane protein
MTAGGVVAGLVAFVVAYGVASVLTGAVLRWVRRRQARAEYLRWNAERRTMLLDVARRQDTERR